VRQITQERLNRLGTTGISGRGVHRFDLLATGLNCIESVLHNRRERLRIK
jgi:hypothetical protein